MSRSLTPTWRLATSTAASRRWRRRSTTTASFRYADRLNYVSPLINNMGYCGSRREALGLSGPERCHYIRVIMSEISRITDHLTCVGASAMELGAFTVFLYMIKAREFLWELVEMVTGRA